ncbi:DnaJ domain protein [Theileria parva strain Muguga]|uniref:J domain-containing protein n=1 Tax=Theileria parva TaxID=5875 RepID=Q4N1A0_THEPA|nr:DnaJ domain protein [Theileria parva strain Muguga]EAN32200.1 DnaJ domain protein [Theileria parva strain Muguga]|eukprot:XP_764483.1 hypothetical protein [Theileria parva strain Muguga]
MDELPSILKGVDVFSLLGIQVDENTDVEEAKKSLRKLFLRKAKKLHPDKQKKDGEHPGDQNDLEFVRIKAAFDFLQTKNNFSLLYNKTLSELRAKRRRLERSKDISSKQATYLDSLLKREKEAFEKRAQEQKKSTKSDHEEHEDKNFYDDVFVSFQREAKEADLSLGQLIVAAKTLEIANGSEINCLLLSSHFPTLFDNYGLLRVEPLEVIDTRVDKNIKVGKIIFKTKEHALRALLHYRNNRIRFRCDLYALALGKDEPLEPKLDDENFEAYEASVLKRFRALAKCNVT